MSRSTRQARMLLGIAVALALTGCTGEPGGAPTTGPTPRATGAPTPSPTPEPPPVLDPSGDAAANLDYFDGVNEQRIAEGGELGGRAFIDALAAAGFSRADMELTPDTTAIGLDADSIQFSVRINGTCLVGQYGNTGYQSVAAPLLSTGTCLVGRTRPIDW